LVQSQLHVAFVQADVSLDLDWNGPPVLAEKGVFNGGIWSPFKQAGNVIGRPPTLFGNKEIGWCTPLYFLQRVAGQCAQLVVGVDDPATNDNAHTVDVVLQQDTALVLRLAHRVLGPLALASDAAQNQHRHANDRHEAHAR
jgi:hypothetical protein